MNSRQWVENGRVWRITFSTDIVIDYKAREVIERLANDGVCVFQDEEKALEEATRRVNLLSLTLEAFDALGVVAIYVTNRASLTGHVLYAGPGAVYVRHLRQE